MNYYPKISLLVPVYGVEKFIERCAVSLFEQTYNNIEYIFVDDCTPDKSIEILKSVINLYPKRKPAVKIIKHERNRGLAAARNTAVKNATGVFVMHVDSDDWLETNTIEKCVTKQNENNADIVSVNTCVWWLEKKEHYITPCTCDPKETMKKVLLREAVCNIWGRLIRTDLYKDNKISVQEGVNVSEDLQVLPKLLFYANRINFISEFLYNYECRNISSYTAVFSEKADMQNLYSTDLLRSFYCKNAPQYLQYVDVLDIKNLILSIKGCMKNSGHQEYYESQVKKRFLKIKKELFSKVPLYDRLILYIHIPFLLRIYIRLASYIKIFCK